MVFKIYPDNSEFHNINALYELKISLPFIYIFFMISIAGFLHKQQKATS